MKLGVFATDKITGFAGYVTAHARYMTGCDQYYLTPKCTDPADLKTGHWFDEGRLTIDETNSINPLSVQGEEKGGPRGRESPPRK